VRRWAALSIGLISRPKRPLMCFLIQALAGSNVACSQRPPPPPSASSVPADVVARVGNGGVGARDAAAIAAAQRIGVREALDVAIRDQLLAEEARSLGLDRTAGARLAIDGVLARALVASLAADARRVPPTPEELAAAAERRWLELDRGEGFRTVHAVVRVAEKASAEERTRAQKLRDDIAAAIAPSAKLARESPPASRAVPWGPATSEDAALAAFLAAAKAFQGKGLEVVVQELEPVTAEGREISEQGGQFVPEFVRAIVGLSARGDLVRAETRYGYHAILLLERTPAKHVPKEELPAILSREIHASRTRAAIRALASSLGGSAELPSNVDALLALAALRP